MIREQAFLFRSEHCFLVLLLASHSASCLSVQRNLRRNSSDGSARRTFFARSILSAFVVVVGNSALETQEALALEERNEILCGTGFFTNIAQYKCTEIGDISGEGKAKKVNEQELRSMESLLGKMGLEDSINDDDQQQAQVPARNKKTKAAVSSTKT
jgi:hypothetical protein